MNPIDIEIQDIINLKETQLEVLQGRKIVLMMMESLTPNEEAKINLMKEYYINLFKFLDKKIEFFNYYKNNEFPKNFIDTMNEALNDWLLSGWAYIGMKEHTQQAKDAKDEFEFYKRVISFCGVIQDKKKPVRRGGKKHRNRK